MTQLRLIFKAPSLCVLFCFWLLQWQLNAQVPDGNGQSPSVEHLGQLLGAHRNIWLRIACGIRHFPLQANVDRIKGFVTEVLDRVLCGGEPPSFTRTGVDFSDLTVLVSESEVPSR